MKKLINKSYVLLLAMMALSINSCVEPVDLITDGARDGGMTVAESTSINYVIGGAGPYVVDLTALQGPSGITAIKLYKSFYDVANKVWSNEVLANETAVPADNMVSVSFTYADLISGLTIGGEPLPEDDTELNIGDFWNMRVESVMDDGAAIRQKSPVKMTVSSRYAGTYTVAVAEYYRIGVPRPDVAWPETMTIESVDATTFRQVEYFGPFSANVLYFTIIDGVIDYPEEIDGTAANWKWRPTYYMHNRTGQHDKRTLWYVQCCNRR